MFLHETDATIASLLLMHLTDEPVSTSGENLSVEGVRFLLHFQNNLRVRAAYLTAVFLRLQEYDDVRKSVQWEQQVLCGLNLGSKR